MVSPRTRRTIVERLVTERGLSQRHACELMSLQRASARYVRRSRHDEEATVALIREYAHEQPMYGYRIIAPMLKHDGYQINRKRVYRIWRQKGLQLPRRKTGKRRYGDASSTLRRAGALNEVWTYDFLEGRTERGGKLRMLTVLDEYTRECLTIHVARSISSGPVVLGRDHHDVSGTDSPYRETANIYDGSRFTADMGVHNVIGDAFRGATWVSLHNGGGVGWGEVMNGGFGLVLDGSADAERRLQNMLCWDVNNGIARRSWARNDGAMHTA